MSDLYLSLYTQKLIHIILFFCHLLFDFLGGKRTNNFLELLCMRLIIVQVQPFI